MGMAGPVPLPVLSWKLPQIWNSISRAFRSTFPFPFNTFSPLLSMAVVGKKYLHCVIFSLFSNWSSLIVLLPFLCASCNIYVPTILFAFLLWVSGVLRPFNTWLVTHPIHSLETFAGHNRMLINTPNFIEFPPRSSYYPHSLSVFSC